MTRRELLALLPASALTLDMTFGAAADALAAQAPAPAPATGPFTLPPLPYPADALEPYIDAQTMTIHHDLHHAAYVEALNKAVASSPDLKKRSIEELVANVETLPEPVRAAVRNQGGGHLNHTMFWASLKKGGGTPGRELAKSIDANFGSFDMFKEAFAVAATGVFGSGWAWLTASASGRLAIETTPNQDNPLTTGARPILGVDVWEHAYYLKYQNKRRDYVDAFFNVIDWDSVQRRWNAPRV